MKNVFIRIFALLGFFLASPAFSATGYQLKYFPQDGCYSSRVYICTVLAPVRYQGTNYAPDSGYELSCSYKATTGVIVGAPLEYCSSPSGTPTPTPTPTITPSPTPTPPPSCESGKNAAAEVNLEGWQDPSLYPWVCSNSCKALPHSDGKSYISCLSITGCSPSKDSNIWGYNHYQLNGETCTETPKYPPTPSPVPATPTPSPSPLPTVTPTPINSCPAGQMLVIRTNGNRECIPAVATPIPGTTPTADPSDNPNVTPLPTSTSGGGGTGTGGGGGGTGGGSGSGDGEGQGVTCTDVNTCDDSDTGASLPSRPQLYQPKYPDGLSGVWTTQMNQLKQTPLATLGSRLLPDIGDGGVNPSFTFDLDFGGVMNMGTHTLEIDPNIWAIIRAIVLVSALIYAYKMIFGG